MKGEKFISLCVVMLVIMILLYALVPFHFDNCAFSKNANPRFLL